MPDDLLFYGNDLRAVLEAQLAQIRRAIEQFDANRLLNANLDDLVTYFVDQATVEPLVLLEDNVFVDHAETKVDVSHRFEYAVPRGGGPHLIPGASVSMHVPFQGDHQLLHCQPSQFTLNPPRGRVSGSEVILSFWGTPEDLGRAKEELKRLLTSVREYVGWTNAQVNQHNTSLPAIVRSDIERRRKRLLDQHNLVASLGYSLKPRPDAPQTYAIPTVRRKAPTTPPASSAPFAPEPALDDSTYEHILTVLGNMVRVMEQSPDAFADMREEDLRTHFLVQLNGQFEGKATGETFRGSGSTDILLTESDRSVFIAECKFWDGPSSLTKALEQLLDYATWRDAKAALLVFNRGTDFTHVLAAGAEALAAFSPKAGELERLGDSAFRLAVRQRDDPSKLIHVTVLLYNVPTVRSTSPRLKPREKAGKPRGA